MIDIFTPSKAAIIYNTAKKSIQQLKAELGCDYIINGGFFNTSFKPTGWLVQNGKVISSDEYHDWGLAIEDGLPVMQTDRGGDYLSLVPLLKGGKTLERSLTPDVARRAERTAIGWTADGRLILAVTDPMVREALQNYMLAWGAVDALMCDGGGSAQGIFPDDTVLTGRKVATLIAVWKKGVDMASWDIIVNYAKTQVGTKENPKGSNKTKYGEWYGNNGQPWCMDFVQYCFAQMNQTLPYKTASCSALLAWYRQYAPEKVFDFPLPGDIVIYNFGHCGIVTDVGATTIKAVEGNTRSTIIGNQAEGDGVYERTREKNKVTAYIRPYKGDGKVNVTLLETR